MTPSNEALELHRSALIVDLHCDILLTTTFLNWNWNKRHRTVLGSPLNNEPDELQGALAPIHMAAARRAYDDRDVGAQCSP